MKKIQVVVLEKYKDSTLRYLGEADIMQFKEIDMEQIDDKDFLTSFTAPSDIYNRYETLSSKISSFFEEYEYNLHNYIKDEQIPTKISGEDLLQSLEMRLDDLQLEKLLKLKDYDRRIDRFLEALGVTKELDFKEVDIDGSLDEYLKQIEATFSEIELTTAELSSLETSASVSREQLNENDSEDSLREITNITNQLLELNAIVKGVILNVKQDQNFEKKLLEAANLYYLAEREKDILQIQNDFLRSDKVLFFEGWVLSERVDEVEELIDTATEGTGVTIVKEPEEHDEVPTVLQETSGVLSAFRNLTYAFGYPTNKEVNTIPLMAVTFSVFFGLMFADLGQGIILALIGLFLINHRKKVNIDEAGDLTRYFLVAGELFVLLGISATLFGLLFGEFFGPSEVIHPISLGRIGPFHFGGFDPAHEPMKMLRLSILFGVIHISMGLVINVINNIRRNHRHEVLISILWLWLLWGGFSMWIIFKGLSQVQLWLSVGLVPFIGLVVAPLLIIMILTSLHGGITEGLGFGVEVFAETLSHTLSYSRLMALGLIHSAMSSIFLSLAGAGHGHWPISGIPVLIIGTAMVMSIEGLVVFIHDLRLHWVEWFSKFYSGEGMIFIPYKFKIESTR